MLKQHHLTLFLSSKLKIFLPTITLLLGLVGVANAQEAVEAAEVAATETQVVDLFSRDSYRIDKVLCPFKGELDYKPGEIECGLLQVPENREKPDSRLIELSFIKLNSTWDEEKENEKDEDERSKLPPGKRDDPVIYLTGGPGAKAFNYVKRFKEHGIRTHRDLYILEQRGIGHSGDFCLKYNQRQPELNNASNKTDYMAAGITAQNNCSQNASAAGADLTGYNTIENARDVKALRRALGFEEWNLWGISYGTIIGQAYINEDPEGIRAIVLDAISPLNARQNIETWLIPTWYDRDLKKLDELCQADDDCADEYPDLGGKVRQSIESIGDNPIKVEVKDTETYPSGSAHVFADIAGYLPFNLMYEQSNYAALPAIIYAWNETIIERDQTLFRAMAQASGMGGYSSSPGMSDAVLCVDGERVSFYNSIKQELQDHPILAGALFTEENIRAIRDRCPEMGMQPRDESDYPLPQTDIPTLLIEGDMDPITPPPLAEIISPGFSNHTYVEFPYAGHGPSRSVKCAGEMLNKFYDNPNDKPDLSCVEEMEKPEFLAPIFRSNIAPRLLLLAVENKKALVGPVAWGGLSALIVLFAFIILILGAIGRKIDHRLPIEIGKARLSAVLASTSGFLSLVIFGAAFAVSAEASEILVLFGLVSWAKYGAVLGLLAGVFGLVVVWQIFLARKQKVLPIATLVGMLLTGIGCSSLSAFFIYWDLAPF